VWDKNDVKDILDAIDSMMSGFYAEGTWTPALKFGGNSVSMTYTMQTGTYTKVGNVVTVEGRIVLSAKGSSTGAASITGLPFSTAGTPTGTFDWFSLNAFTAMPYFAASATTMSLGKSGGSSRTNMTDADFTNTTDLRWSFTYRV
jgi:hypothetical protein